MASKSGRRGDFTPESKEMMESTMQLDDDDRKEAAANGGGYGKRPPVCVPAPAKPAASATNVGSPGGFFMGAEGCKVCHQDNDHENLLLCEACNDEYHTYCLNPPLQSVPEGDFFCGKFLGVQGDPKFSGPSLLGSLAVLMHMSCIRSLTCKLFNCALLIDFRQV